MRSPFLAIRHGLLAAMMCASTAHAQDAERGERLAGLAGCAACHTAEDGAPLAGGYELDTRFGTFYGSNITPDPEHGIGGWSFEDFERAIREGRNPDGLNYWPAFPFTSFTWMTDRDLRDLWAWLQSVPPSDTPSRPQEPRKRFAGMLGLWRGFVFPRNAQGPWPLDTSDPVDRGEYLGTALAHCGECHTPRTSIGKLKPRRPLAGTNEPPEPAPNITPGALDWSADDWDTFLTLGMTPEGDFVGGEMYRVVEEGTAKLSDEEREALITWLLQVPPSR